MKVQQVGDIGDVAVMLRQSKDQTGSPLTLSSIVASMKEINAFEGHESQSMKLEKLSGLFLKTKTDDELRYLVRSFANTGLRIGLSSKSVEKCILDFFEDEETRKEADK